MMRPRRWTLVKFAVSAAALGSVAALFPLGQAAAALARASPTWLAVALLAKAAAVVGSAMAWRGMLPAALRPRPLQACRTYLASLHAGIVGPGNLAGDAYRATAAVGMRNADTGLAAVLGERALVFAALAAAAAGGAWASPPAAGLRAPLGALALLAGGALAASVGVGARLAGLVPGRRLAARAARSGLRALAGLGQPRVAGPALAGAALVPVANTAAVVALFAGLGQDVEPGFALFAASAAALVVLLPLSVQGLGVREGAYVLLFTGLAGIPAPTALAASVLSLALTLVLALLGGLALWAPERAGSTGARGGARPQR